MKFNELVEYELSLISNISPLSEGAMMDELSAKLSGGRVVRYIKMRDDLRNKLFKVKTNEDALGIMMNISDINTLIRDYVRIHPDKILADKNLSPLFELSDEELDWFSFDSNRNRMRDQQRWNGFVKNASILKLNRSSPIRRKALSNIGGSHDWREPYTR